MKLCTEPLKGERDKLNQEWIKLQRSNAGQRVDVFHWTHNKMELCFATLKCEWIL